MRGMRRRMGYESEVRRRKSGEWRMNVAMTRVVML